MALSSAIVPSNLVISSSKRALTSTIDMLLLQLIVLLTTIIGKEFLTLHIENALHQFVDD